MNRQESYKERYRQLKPGWRDSLAIYVGLVDSHVTPASRVLDVGCGHGEYLKSVYEKSDRIYGLDPDERALERNTIIKNTICGSVEALPFPDDFFDLIVSVWVLEHLENPAKAFKEMHRVLKPQGKVIFLTPNAWNYNTWGIRLLPDSLHHFFTRKLYHRQEHDTFDKYYRVNSVKKIDKILGAAGFRKVEMILNGDPSYISFNDFLFRFSCFVEDLMEKRFDFARVHLIGLFEK